MKNFIIILSLFINILFANDINSKLHEKIFQGIFPQNDNILIYDIGNKKHNFKQIEYTKEIYNCDLIFINEFYRLEIYNNKPIFVSSLLQLKLYRNAIGALFWEKGIPKIIFFKHRLSNHKIKLAKYLEKYVVDEKKFTFEL